MLLLLFLNSEPLVDIPLVFQRKDYTTLGAYKKEYNPAFKKFNQITSRKSFTIK
jgi:hypothetical protein